jgi:hypothetical protein
VPHKINFGAVEGENRGSDPMPTPIERIDKCVEPTLPDMFRGSFGPTAG